MTPIASKLDSPVSYLALPDGTAFIPIGANLCFPRFITEEAEGLALYRSWLDRLSEAGGNFFRLFLGHTYFDIEPDRCGEFSEERATRLRAVLDLAAARGLRVKLTLDHFRFIDPQPVAESFPGAARFDRSLLHCSRGGPAPDMEEYLGSDAGRGHYLAKLDWLAARFRDHPAVFAWELWNEMDSVKARNWRTWTEFMFPALRDRFPGALRLQSLGSYDTASKDDNYRWLATLPETEVVQIHRYLDLAPKNFPVCKGPIDVMAASAIRELRSVAPERPVILAESGAVEPGHSAPSNLYEHDPEGTILHDVLFAPFFAGAAGPGQIWHWDFYLARHNLWWHFRTFRTAIEGLNANTESLTPQYREMQDLRIYELRGRSTRLIWLRDASCDWRTELRDQTAAPIRRDTCFSDVAGYTAWEVLDPWTQPAAWQSAPTSPGCVHLPAWRRSLLLRGHSEN